MGIVVFCCAALVFTLVLAIMDTPRRTLGAKERRLRAIEESGTAYYGELQGNVFERLLGPAIARVKRAATTKRSRRKKDTGKLSAGMEKREKQLRAAGLYIGANTFVLIKTGATVALIGIAALIVMNIDMEAILKLLIVAMAGMLAFLGPDYFIKFLASSRHESMRKQLPDMMDLLSVSIDAGLGFDAALKRALDRFTGALREELSIASMEISMGKARRDALSDMADRCDIKELRIMVAAIVQSEQMGTPIKNVLKTQSAQLRINRKQAAQEKGMKAPVKMLIPMVGLIFPVLLIILLAPTLFNIVTVL